MRDGGGDITRARERSRQSGQSTLDALFEHGVKSQEEGNGVEAERYYKRAADCGHAAAQQNFANLLRLRGTAKETLLANRYSQEAALQGNASAQFSMGLVFEQGDGEDVDFAKAVYWYEAAVKQNFVKAIINLAILTESGKGTAKDHKQAFTLFKRAAAQSSPVGMFNVGRCYHFGIGVKECGQKAVEAYSAAAKLGNYNALFQLGSLYVFGGHGVAKDEVSGIRLLLAAATGGRHRHAQSTVAWCFNNGVGTEIDHVKAVHFYECAARQGDVTSQVNLANAYMRGAGVPQNIDMAYKWYEEAAQQGSVEGATMVLNIQTRRGLHK